MPLERSKDVSRDSQRPTLTGALSSEILLANKGCFMSSVFTDQLMETWDDRTWRLMLDGHHPDSLLQICCPNISELRDCIYEMLRQGGAWGAFEDDGVLYGNISESTKEKALVLFRDIKLGHHLNPTLTALMEALEKDVGASLGPECE